MSLWYVAIRRCTGPAMLYPDGTVVTTEHAIETARRFWEHLTG
jgi:hypothetical protein